MLQIKKGGILIDLEDNIDITEKTTRCLFEECNLAEDITLKDIFLLLNRDLEFYDCIFRLWVKEIVTEGLSKDIECSSEIKYLEIYRYPEYSEKILNEELSIHGISGKDTYGLSFSPAYELMNYPLKLNTKYSINFFLKKGYKFGKKKFLLWEILYAILWELTWHGGPETRDELNKELTERVDDIKNNISDSVPFEYDEPKEWYIYLLYNEKIKKSYIGIAKDVQKRFEKHKSGKGSKFIRYTKDGWELKKYVGVFREAEAKVHEYKLKKNKGYENRLKAIEELEIQT